MSDNDQKPRKSALETYVRASIAHEVFPTPYTQFRKEMAGAQLAMEVIGGAIVAAGAAIFAIGYGVYAVADYAYETVKPPIVEAYNAVGDAVAIPARGTVTCPGKVNLLKGAWGPTAFEIYFPPACDEQKVAFNCDRPSRPPSIQVTSGAGENVGYIITSNDRTCRLDLTRQQPK